MEGLLTKTRAKRRKNDFDSLIMNVKAKYDLAKLEFNWRIVYLISTTWLEDKFNKFKEQNKLNKLSIVSTYFSKRKLQIKKTNSCAVVSAIWKEVNSWSADGFATVLPLSIHDLFWQNTSMGSTRSNNVWWLTIWCSVFFCVWRKRNAIMHL